LASKKNTLAPYCKISLFTVNVPEPAPADYVEAIVLIALIYDGVILVTLK